MKIAFLVLAHKNPDQINLLIETLIKGFNCDIYLHMDKKRYELTNVLKKYKNVFVISKDDSYEISWGGLNMINATLKLIRCAKNSNYKYDYLYLVSGQDYLISSPDNVIKILENNYGKNFINIIDKETKEYNRYQKLYEMYYPNWMLENKIICKLIKRVYMVITGGYTHTFNVFKRKKTFNFDFAFGSQWWVLTSECAYYMLNFCDNNPQYIQYFKKTIIPDECFFQTLFNSSPYKNTQKDKLTFVKWKSGARSPETLTLKDYKLISSKSKQYCFARKFDIDIDKKIIDKLNKNIKSRRNKK